MHHLHVMTVMLHLHVVHMMHVMHVMLVMHHPHMVLFVMHHCSVGAGRNCQNRRDSKCGNQNSSNNLFLEHETLHQLMCKR